MSGYGTSDTGSFAHCSVWLHDGSDYDWSTARAWSDAALVTGGAPALYFDVVDPLGPMTEYRATFVIAGPESVFTLECILNEPDSDPWLSIAETIEFPPRRLPHPMSLRPLERPAGIALNRRSGPSLSCESQCRP